MIACEGMPGILLVWKFFGLVVGGIVIPAMLFVGLVYVVATVVDRWIR